MMARVLRTNMAFDPYLFGYNLKPFTHLFADTHQLVPTSALFVFFVDVVNYVLAWQGFVESRTARFFLSMSGYANC